jgi:HD-GYP domain-containing protein (c-di-GMP phosphodiesterase class II)
MQGFVIEDENTLTQVREHCREVVVDSKLSAAGSFAGVGNQPPPSADRLPHHSVTADALEIEPPRADLSSDPEEQDYRQDVTQIRSYFLSKNASRENSRADREIVLYKDSTSFFSEVPEAKAAADITVRAAKRFFDRLAEEKFPDIDQVTEAVGLVVESITRNSSAMLWLSGLQKKGDYLYSRAIDSTILMVAFGRQLGLPKTDLITLGIAGISLDIGKVKLPKELLDKPEKLNDEEMEACRSHVMLSLFALSESKDIPEAVLEIVSRHHERFNGEGYPFGLHGPDIGLFASMAGIVDTYTALTSNRPFAKTKSPSEALRVLHKSRDSLFQGTLVDQFIQCVGIYPVGSVVELSTGDVAIVVEVYRARRLKPKVMLVLGPDKVRLSKPTELDLATNPRMVGDEIVSIRRDLPPDEYGLSLADLFR